MTSSSAAALRDRPRVLVTGAGGFVGRALCCSLAARGWDVVAATRGVAEASREGIRPATLELLETADEWRSALKGCAAVVHLAARVHELGRSSSETEFRRVNVEGSRFVAERAAEAGVRRFVYLSSIKVNGECTTTVYSEADAPAPRDAYGRSKWAAEQELRAFCPGHSLELAVIRPPLVYGPGVRANFARLMRLARSGLPLPLEGIDNRRSFIGLTNLTDFIAHCLVHEAAASHTWLVSDGEDLSTCELLRRLAALMHRPSRLFRVPPRALARLAAALGVGGTLQRLTGSLQVDSSAARTLLSWHPPQSVDQELARTVAAFERST